MVSVYPKPNLAFRKSEEPAHRSFPELITAILSARMSASCHNDRREAGSIPEVGSSSSTQREPPMSEQATDSLRLIPPDSACERA
eukprot:scaffold112272_cov32-Tisochrysis_lutea.AAC.4